MFGHLEPMSSIRLRNSWLVSLRSRYSVASSSATSQVLSDTDRLSHPPQSLRGGMVRYRPCFSFQVESLTLFCPRSCSFSFFSPTASSSTPTGSLPPSPTSTMSSDAVEVAETTGASGAGRIEFQLAALGGLMGLWLLSLIV